MKHLFYMLLLTIFIYSCGTTNKTVPNNQSTKDEVVVISNDSLEYEIIITDIRFNTYLNSIAKPASYYSQDHYELKNLFYVTEWNIRASNPLVYGDLYQERIDYQSSVNYGLDVNYKLYNYFKFCEHEYGIRFR